MEKILKLAVESGYEGNNVKFQLDFERLNTHNGVRRYQWSGERSYKALLMESVLDPLFWQALGKSLGWNQIPATLDNEKIMFPKNPNKNANYYIFYWHRFIDHLIAGKSAESYFEELLK